VEEVEQTIAIRGLSKLTRAFTHDSLRRAPQTAEIQRAMRLTLVIIQ
jgi:hypothetical protein